MKREEISALPTFVLDQLIKNFLHLYWPLFTSLVKPPFTYPFRRVFRLWIFEEIHQDFPESVVGDFLSVWLHAQAIFFDYRSHL